MTTLLLVRHGETEWNRTLRIQGSTDIPLNDTGRAQARDAASVLRDTIDPLSRIVVVASDLSRASETAEIIAAQLGVDAPRLYPGLRERAYGEAEGLAVEEFRARWGDWRSVEVPGAETGPDLRVRAVRALRAVARDVRRETAPGSASVVVVTHGALIREVTRHASGGAFPPEGVRLANGSVHPMLLERDRMRLLTAVVAS